MLCDKPFFAAKMISYPHYLHYAISALPFPRSHSDGSGRDIRLLNFDTFSGWGLGRHHLAGAVVAVNIWYPVLCRSQHTLFRHLAGSMPSSGESQLDRGKSWTGIMQSLY